MPFVLLALLVLAVVMAGYFVLLVAPLGFLAAGAVAAVLPFVDVAQSSFNRFGGAAAVDGLGLEPPPEASGRDPAVRGYLFGPAYREFVLVCREAGAVALRRFVAMLDWIALNVRDRELPTWRWINFAIGLATQAGVVAGGLVFGLVLVVVGGVFGTYLVVTGVVALVVAVVLSVVERAVLVARGITVECPNCHERVTRPMYRCSGPEGCGALHKQLVPGTSGVLRRICRCGRSLPTTLLLGKWKLASQCPKCPAKAELPPDSQRWPTAHVPVVGGPQVGKSVFMLMAIKRLHARWSQAPSSMPFWGSTYSAELTQQMMAALENPADMRKTVATGQPMAFNVHLAVGGRKWLVYLYDTGGEVYESQDTVSEATFLSYLKGVVLCVDPFALNGVRRNASTQLVREVRSLTKDPRGPIGTFLEGLREIRHPEKGGRLRLRAAVVITKGDALVRSGVTLPYAHAPVTRAERDEAVRTWLEGIAGHPDLVATIEQNFEHVSWYVTGHEAGTDGSVVLDAPEAPLLWALTGNRE